MRGFFERRCLYAVLAIALLGFESGIAAGSDTLTWQTSPDRVTADVSAVPLTRLLESIARLTGWQIYLESNTTLNVSAKFRDLPSGEALRHLLGDLNFALVPQTNASPRLYVFRSSMANATQLIQPDNPNSPRSKSARPIARQIVVTLKPGAKIDDLARLLGAKITGRIDGLNTYRLEFDSDAAAQSARDSLVNNPDVDSIDSNFPVDLPYPVQQLNANVAPDFNLKAKAAGGDCHVIVGQIDTGLQLGKSLDSFILPTISVVGDPQSSGAFTHGSAMAETILRSVQSTTGGSTSVKILPVDVYGNNPTTTTFDVAQGIYQAVNAGANIINLSLGGSGDSTVLHNLIKNAYQQGVVFFAAAGNEPVTTPTYPAAYPEVIAVTAGDRNGQIASYANRGSFVDIMTPGTSVVPYNGQSYIVTGTSPATAFATGIAAGLADSSRDCPSQVVPTILSKLALKPATPP